MGTTIHYSGRAKDHKSFSQLMNTAQMFAAEREWMFAMFDDPLGHLEDRDPDDSQVPGYISESERYENLHLPARGLVLRPHRKCEPVRLTFNSNHELDAFTKTQFAPFTVHVEIIRLLREIEPFMERLTVIDESGLWESGDEADAKARFDALGSAIDAMAAGLEDAGADIEGPGVGWDDEEPDDQEPGDGVPDWDDEDE